MKYIAGENRYQLTLLPECIEDYIAEDNPVQVIEAFVNSLNMAQLGFERSAPQDTGRPPYDPRDLLKLYIYGYCNRIRSSRRLMQECGRNIELFWLLRKLRPDFRTAVKRSFSRQIPRPTECTARTVFTVATMSKRQ